MMKLNYVTTRVRVVLGALNGGGARGAFVAVNTGLTAPLPFNTARTCAGNCGRGGGRAPVAPPAAMAAAAAALAGKGGGCARA